MLDRPLVVEAAPYACGHPIQMLDEHRLVTRPDGTAIQERVPRRFEVREHPQYCPLCGQIVDA